MDGTLEAVTRDMTGERKEVFRRVWQRVMHGGPAEDGPAEERLLPALSPPAEGPGGDYPGPPGVLGEDCLEFAGLLQGLLRRALEDGRSYQALARRAGGSAGRELAALGAQARQGARELGAVCFLISGARPWPDPGKGTAPGSYLGSLRRLFRREQETMAADLAGAETVTDPCLRELLLRHAAQAWDRSCRIRGLVEMA